MGVESGDEVRVGEVTVVRFEFFEGAEKGEEKGEKRKKREGAGGSGRKRAAGGGVPRQQQQHAAVDVEDVHKENRKDQKDDVVEVVEVVEKATKPNTTTVLEHIEAHCAQLERDLVARGAEAARKLREAWDQEKRSILARLDGE